MEEEKIEKIEKIEKEGIYLSNGYKIVDCHRQDCCEDVYADWNYLNMKDLIGGEINLNLSQTITPVDKAGFKIKIRDRWYNFDYFVPCYNQQNGYYSAELKLQLKNQQDEVLEEIDITSNTINQYRP